MGEPVGRDSGHGSVAARLIAQQESHGEGGASVLRDQAGKSKSQARRSLGTAEVLDEMPVLRAAVDSGEVALANAERLADAAQRTAPEAVDSASDLLALAKELPPDKFAREASAWAQRPGGRRRSRAREVTEQAAAEIGGAFRTLAEVLTEVADGESELIFVGG